MLVAYDVWAGSKRADATRIAPVGKQAFVATLPYTRLAAYKVPRALWFVDDLPKTSTGKIMRRALRDAQPLQAGG